MRMITRNRIKKRDEHPMKIPFELPHNYPAVVMTELEADYLSAKGKTKFIASVASSIHAIKNYPTTDELNHIGQQILIKCPFLKSKSGTGYVSIIIMHYISLLEPNTYRVI